MEVVRWEEKERIGMFSRHGRALLVGKRYFPHFQEKKFGREEGQEETDKDILCNL
jgi:hypothetical protein